MYPQGSLSGTIHDGVPLIDPLKNTPVQILYMRKSRRDQLATDSLTSDSYGTVQHDGGTFVDIFYFIQRKFLIAYPPGLGNVTDIKLRVGSGVQK